MWDAIAISVESLSKALGNTLAVDRVSFDVRPGEVFGFSGHNEAGKTTILRMLLELLRPSGRGASVLGYDIVRDSLAIPAGVRLTARPLCSAKGAGRAALR